MLIPVSQLKKKFGVMPNGVLHVGAHLGEEFVSYNENGWSKANKIIWIESQSILVEELKRTLPSERNHIINATVWNKSGVEMSFKIASNSQSSSLLNFGTHESTYPDIHMIDSMVVRTMRLDEIITTSDNIDFLNLDIQGAELHALQGLGTHLSRVKWIYSEVNKIEVYKGCALIQDLDAYLRSFGFKRVATRWVSRAGWGDALWAQSDLIAPYRWNILVFKLIEILRVLYLEPRRIAGMSLRALRN